MPFPIYVEDEESKELLNEAVLKRLSEPIMIFPQEESKVVISVTNLRKIIRSEVQEAVMEAIERQKIIEEYERLKNRDRRKE